MFPSVYPKVSHLHNALNSRPSGEDSYKETCFFMWLASNNYQAEAPLPSHCTETYTNTNTNKIKVSLKHTLIFTENASDFINNSAIYLE